MADRLGISLKVALALTLMIPMLALGSQPPVEEWNRTFGGSGWDVGASIQLSSDGGYVIAGRTDLGGSVNADVWLVKTDGSGRELWNRTFGGSGVDEGCAVQQTSDGGYIIAGETDSYGAGGEDLWVIKTDPQGNMQWDKTFGGPADDEGRSVQQISDGSYIIAGWTSSYGAGGIDVWLIRIDGDGNQLWTQAFGGLGNESGISVSQTADGGFVIAGTTDSFGSGKGDIWVIKTDPQGNKQWDRTYGGKDDDYGSSGQPTIDSGYIIAGRTHSIGSGDGDAWLIKTDSQGFEQWNMTFGGPEDDGSHLVQQTDDGGYLVVGTTESYGTGGVYGGCDVWLIKTNSNGSELWNGSYGGSSTDFGFSARQTDGCCYIILGWRVNSDYDSDVWLIKLGAIGEAPATRVPSLSAESCTPLTPLWAAQFRELAGVSPLRACQCEGDGYHLTLVEFANSTECGSSELALRENLDGEVMEIEGEEGFWQVYWLPADELGLLCQEAVLYMIAAPRMDADVMAAALSDHPSSSSQMAADYGQLNLSAEDRGTVSLPSASEPSDRSKAADLGGIPLTREELTSSEWQFRRGDGSVIGTLRLLPDGSIGGYSHPNESRWQVQDGAIVFYHQDGRETTRFDTFTKDQGQWVISGPFLLGGEVMHILSQISAPQSTG